MTAPVFKNRLISKIHVAKKFLALDDDSYRAVLVRVTGKSSSSAMSVTELNHVLDEFKRLGFVTKPSPKKSGGRKMADEPQARKIRAMWITLGQMGQVRDTSEKALCSFIEKTTDVSDMHWLDSASADKVIKALRGWISRTGGNPNDY